MAIESTIDYYVNLLIIQYNQLEKAKATVALNVRILLSDDIANQVQDGYNLETAVGVQLDVLGKYIGVDRFFTASGTLIGDFFSMTSYPTLGTDTDVGMTDYANYATDIGGFATYGDLAVSQVLDDDDYRLILKLKIIQNNSDHSQKSIDDGLFTFFADGIVKSSNTNMTMIYFVNNANLDIALKAFAKKVLPRPMGVRLNGLIQRDKKILGFTNYSRTLIPSGITGFTNYTDGFTKEGEILNYSKVINF